MTNVKYPNPYPCHSIGLSLLYHCMSYHSYVIVVSLLPHCYIFVIRELPSIVGWTSLQRAALAGQTILKYILVNW